MKKTCSLLMSIFVAAAGAYAAEREPINCSLAYTDNSLTQCTKVRFASEFASCLSNSDITDHTCIVMDSDLEFCDSETSVPVTAHFSESSRSLDCNGGSIDHGWGRARRTSGPATTQATRSPGIRLLDDTSLSDIKVSNCTIRGTNHMGIKASRFFGGELGGDGVISENEQLPVGHHQLVFENLKVEDTITGIFLGNFSEDVIIDNVHVDNSERISIYVEAGSHRIVLKDSVVSNNKSREAVAIDSAYDSEISNSLFINNRESAINLYQNCGELKGIVCPVIRSTPPNNNRITGNRFIGNGFSGLQIASRQGRNHTLGWCATLNGQPGKFVDTAQNNVVRDNTFICHEGTSLKVHDAPNTIINNTIIARDDCVPFEISTGGLDQSFREVLDGLIFKSNRVESTRAPRLRNLSSRIEFSDE